VKSICRLFTHLAAQVWAAGFVHFGDEARFHQLAWRGKRDGMRGFVFKQVAKPYEASEGCKAGSLISVPTEFEHAAYRARNHQFFVRANDANRGPAGVRAEHRRCVGDRCCLLNSNSLILHDNT
jgi:hypothetical protein